MFLAPYITVFFMATIFSLLIAPRFEYDYPSLKYITESYPYALASRKTTIKASTRTKSDTVFGDQETTWKPVEASQGGDDDDDEFHYSDEYTVDTINAWHESNVFHRPKATLEFGTEQSDELMFEAEDKESESLRRICEVLMLSGIEYSACQSLNQPIVVDQVTTSSPWTEVSELGIRWKEVGGGADKGCFYFIKTDSIPLKLTAIPNQDGTTKLSYYTKNTIGKYCPEDDNPAEVELFYKNLTDEIQPAKLAVFLNTKVYGEFTVYDLFEFQMLLDACLIAPYKSLSQGGPPTRKTLIEFFTLYGIVYGLYYVFVK